MILCYVKICEENVTHRLLEKNCICICVYVFMSLCTYILGCAYKYACLHAEAREPHGAASSIVSPHYFNRQSHTEPELTELTHRLAD